MSATSSEDNIQVFVRIRPLTQTEESSSKNNCVDTMDSDASSILLDSKPNPKQFSYDWVGPHSTTQETIFSKVGRPTAERFLEGYNCTVFAYGQTGAGKTYTMQGKGPEIGSSQDKQHRGLQPRVFEHVFARMRDEMKKGTAFLLKCSHFEIYNEQIIDLLNPSSGSLQLREDFKRGAFIEGITEEIATNADEALGVMLKGARNRHVGATSMNFESSRSHSVFTMILESKRLKDGMMNVISSKLHFVDLAGSERQKSTNTSGKRLKEAGNINKSLTVLGSVINSLVESSKGKKMHIRYRDSKLTFLLKDSLGGNSKTSIIANVNPSSSAFGETLSTLKFAQRAKQIRNNASINEEASGCVESLKNEIKRLKKMLESKNCVSSVEEDHQMVQEGEDWKSDPISHRENIVEQNKSQLELEFLLKESMDILNETERRLQEEYKKKDEFMELFKTACNTYESKENQMRMMLKLYASKKENLDNGEWTKDDEVKKLQHQIKSMQIMLDGAPQIMKVYTENIQLKHQIEYSEQGVKSSSANSFKKMHDLLSKNFVIMDGLSKKLDSSICQRTELDKKFERICHWTGMTSEDLKRLEEAQENKKLEKTIELLKYELLERKQAEEEINRHYQNEKKRVEQIKQTYEKIELDHRAEIINYEKRILELRNSYENMGNNESIESVKLRDEIQALILQRDELLARIDRSKEMLEAEQKEREEAEAVLYAQLETVKSDKFRLEQRIEKKNHKIEKLDSEIDMVKAELSTVTEKLLLETSKIEQLKQATKETVEGEMRSQFESQLEVLQNEKDSLEEEISMLNTEKEALKEELDTLQTSSDYLNDELNAKSAEIKELSEKVSLFEKTNLENIDLIEAKDKMIDDLQKEVVKHANSNSPHNVAIKENYSLRNSIRELKAKLDEKTSEVSKSEIERTTALEQVEYLKKREAYFKDAYKDISVENQKHRKNISELVEKLSQKDKELNEINIALQRSQEDNSSIRKSIEVYQGTIEVNQKRFNELREKIGSKDATMRALQEKLKKKIDEYQTVSDSCNTASLKLFTLNQEMEALKSNSERQISHLSSSLKTLYDKYTELIRSKFQREEEFKKVADKHDSQIRKLQKEINEYKEVVADLEKDGVSEPKLKEMRVKACSNLEVDCSELEAVKSELAKVKLELNEKRSQCFQLYTKCDSIMETYSGDIEAIKSNFSRLDIQFKIVTDSVSIKEKEALVLRDENRLLDLEKGRLEDQIDELKSESKKFKKQLLNGNLIIERLSKENATLRSEYDVLNKVHQCYLDDNPEYRDLALNEIEEKFMETTKEVKKLSKELCSKKIKAISIEQQEFKPWSSEITLNDFLKAFELLQKEANLTKAGRRRSLKDIKTSSDLEKVVNKMVGSMRNIVDREKDLAVKEYECESRILRCSILEKEIDIIKHNNSVIDGNYRPDNIIPSSKGRAPEYITSNRKKFRVGNISNLGETLIGKRYQAEEECLVLKDRSNRKLPTLPTHEFNTPSKRSDIDVVKRIYSGLKENNFDPNNYDYEASTPKKRIKLL